MINQFINRCILIGLACSVVLTPWCYAQNDDAQKIVQKTTEQVLAIIKDAKSRSTIDSKQFNAEITSILDKAIDFDSFSRNVMGSYASDQRFRALTTESERIAFRERISRFKSTFKQRLIDTYVTSLLNFNGENIEIPPLKKGADLNSDSATVLQIISSSSGKSYTIQYSMHRNKEGEWKLKNLIIEGVNLGLTYRNQFAESADKYKGDLDKVIANWSVEPGITNTNKANEEYKGGNH